MLSGTTTLASNNLDKEEERRAVLIRRDAMRCRLMRAMPWLLTLQTMSPDIFLIRKQNKTQFHTCINTKAQDLALTAI